MKIPQLLCLVFMPLPVLAVGDDNSPLKSIQNSDAFSSTSPLTVLFGLMFVLALIFLMAWLAKQYTKTGFMANQAMKIVASLSLGSKERLLLVEIGDKQILLGVTPSSVNRVHVFDEKVVEKNSPQPNEFASKLKQFIHDGQSNKQANSESID